MIRREERSLLDRALFIGLRGFNRQESQIYLLFYRNADNCKLFTWDFFRGLCVSKRVVTLADDGLVITSPNVLELSQDA